MASRYEHPSSAPVALLLPELDCEGPGYWQQRWAESRIDCRPVNLGHARIPDRNSLVTWLDRAVRSAEAPLILVGHGVGALTIAAWAGLMSNESEAVVAGALLIAPSDPAAPGADTRLRDFAPLPASIFSFPTLVVASDDDPTLSADRAFSLARQWGAGFARFGACGHFTPDDGIGWWPQGEQLMDRFIELIEPGGCRGHRDIDMLALAASPPVRPAQPFLLRR